MEDPQILTCPFCGFKDSNDYQMLLHVEIMHSENGDSPFAVKDTIAPSAEGHPARTPPAIRTPSPEHSEQQPRYADCPHQCGERVLTTELQFHTDFHMAEDLALEDPENAVDVDDEVVINNDDGTIRNVSNIFTTTIADPLRNQGQLKVKRSSNGEKNKTSSLKELFFGSPNRKRTAPGSSTPKSTKIKRLGTAELGPYAHEKRMPAWLERMLTEGAKTTVSNRIGLNGTLVRVETIANETSDLIPTLARLSLKHRTVARAFYCSPLVRHVAKMPKEGGFCGYRNVQMLISYIRDEKAPGYQKFQGRLPSIIKLQEMIENAWDQGFNSSGRVETGGIRLTRKYIGTPEAQALFLSLGVPCEAVAYSSRGGDDAYTTLMNAVFNYFEDDRLRYDEHRVFITRKPPIYFQHQGHSMTIVGVEVHKNGNANLVVFDPMFNPSPSVKKIVGATQFHCSEPGKLLKAHRRGESYLSKYKDFELLKITGPEVEGFTSILSISR